MSTLNERQNTAVLIVDMQRGVVAGAHRRDAVVDKVAALVARARRESVPVVWVQHVSARLAHGSDDWRIVPELVPAEAEPLIEKSYGDAFEGTTLESVLSVLGVGRLVVAGAQTDACIRSTIHGAFARGYDVTLVGDAHTTEDQTAWGAPPPDKVIAHTNLYWTYQEAPGRKAETVDTASVELGGARRHETRALGSMTKYLISFPGSAMNVRAEEWTAVGEAAHAVIREAKAAGVYVFAGGINEDVAPRMVARDGSVTNETYPQTKELDGGMCVLELPSREAAIAWAAKIAEACRCSQELREFQYDPEI